MIRRYHGLSDVMEDMDEMTRSKSWSVYLAYNSKTDELYSMLVGPMEFPSLPADYDYRLLTSQPVTRSQIVRYFENEVGGEE